MQTLRLKTLKMLKSEYSAPGMPKSRVTQGKRQAEELIQTDWGHITTAHITSETN